MVMAMMMSMMIMNETFLNPYWYGLGPSGQHFSEILARCDCRSCLCNAWTEALSQSAESCFVKSWQLIQHPNRTRAQGRLGHGTSNQAIVAGHDFDFPDKSAQTGQMHQEVVCFSTR